MIKLVVALGNPGLEYEFTRHNIAWLVLDQLDLIKSATWKKKFKGEYCEINLNGEKIYFLKPLTYMNLSGQSVVELMNFFKIQVNEILVVQDELDLPFGQLSFKNGGGLAGHNGLKSINQCLGTADFKRLRIGIGRPQHGSVSAWVLSAFNDVSDADCEIVFKGSAEALQLSVEKSFEAASQVYSKKKLL